MSTPWLTVVTVVRDDEEGLRATFDSLQRADLTGVEVLIVDSSADDSYARILAKGIARCLWTEPAGIYPAMNTGLALARGDYVYYLNAGDTLQDASSLFEIRGAIEQVRPVWMFGPVEIIDAGGRSTVTPSWDYGREKNALFARGLFPPHQGTVVRAQALRAIGGFDLSYRIAADYAAFLRLSCVADPCELHGVLATFHEGGASTAHWQESFREFHRARRSILQPTGMASVRERVNTSWHFVKVLAYREVALRARR